MNLIEDGAEFAKRFRLRHIKQILNRKTPDRKANTYEDCATDSHRKEASFGKSQRADYIRTDLTWDNLKVKLDRDHSIVVEDQSRLSACINCHRGDVNQLSDRHVVELAGLTQIMCQPTCGTNILDRFYVSISVETRPVRVVTSVVKRDHKVRHRSSNPHASSTRSVPVARCQHGLHPQ